MRTIHANPIGVYRRPEAVRLNLTRGRALGRVFTRYEYSLATITMNTLLRVNMQRPRRLHRLRPVHLQMRTVRVNKSPTVSADVARDAVVNDLPDLEQSSAPHRRRDVIGARAVSFSRGTFGTSSSYKPRARLRDIIRVVYLLCSGFREQTNTSVTRAYASHVMANGTRSIVSFAKRT